MSIETGIFQPEAVTIVKRLGMKQRTINFDITETSDGYQWYSVTLPLGQWSYASIVRAIIYARYTADQIEAINSNISRIFLDPTTVPAEKGAEYRAEALALQKWRDHAKTIAKELLDNSPQQP